MKTVFVSGCYDILHAGHIQFFTEARALGSHLTACFASDKVLYQHKQRRSSIPEDHKRVLLESLRMVDRVVMGEDPELGLDFKSHFLRLKPDLLVVTEDDHYADAKRALCAAVGAEYCILPKTPPQFTPVSSSSIVRYVRAPDEAPLRVDLAGGWLDVPRFSREDGYIVNCAISPTVSLRHWPYERNAGLGGSAAWARINGHEAVAKELEMGVGWQDPAIVIEGGLCVWKSGQQPRLELKLPGDLLSGRMALFYTGSPHDTPGLVEQPKRDFQAIAAASRRAREAVWEQDFQKLMTAVQESYQVQLREGMAPLPEMGGSVAVKYCGSGHGGYACFFFADEPARKAALSNHPELRPIEPWEGAVARSA